MDFKNATPLYLLDKNNKVMNLSAVYNYITAVYPLKISLSSDKNNVFKMSSIEDMGHLFSEAAFSFVFIRSKLTKELSLII